MQWSASRYTERSLACITARMALDHAKWLFASLCNAQKRQLVRVDAKRRSLFDGRIQWQTLDRSLLKGDMQQSAVSSRLGIAFAAKASTTS